MHSRPGCLSLSLVFYPLENTPPQRRKCSLLQCGESDVDQLAIIIAEINVILHAGI